MSLSEKVLPKSLLRVNFVWTTVGNALYLASQWLLIVILAKLGNPEMVGKYAFSSAVVTPVMILSQLNLRYSLVTDIKDEFSFTDCYRLRLLFSFLAWLIIIVIAWVSQSSVEMLIITGLLGLAKSFESVSDVIYGKFQKHDRMDLIAISLISRGLLTILFFGPALWFFRDLTAAVGTMVVVWGAILYFYDRSYSLRIEPVTATPPWDLPALKKLFWTTLPLSVNSFFGSLSGNLPRYFLEYFGNKESIGLFSVASAPINFFTLFQNSLLQTILHQLSIFYHKGDEKSFKRLSLKAVFLYLFGGVLFTLLFALGGKYFLAVVFSPEYVSGVPVLVLMSAGATVTSLSAYFLFAIIAGRKFIILAVISFLILLGQFIASFFLIRSWGVIGAGWADLIKSLFALIICFLFGTFVKGEKFSGKQKNNSEEHHP